jgi:nitroimidazol reductase NimA-like FMN-containing flavoprotein (pyridoxamine 5'-phosphate oxidase superfamily)
MSIETELPDNAFPTTDRSRLRRFSKRGSNTRADVYALLDAAPFCHVGYSIDGQPFVTPTLHWRNGDRVYWHGSGASRMLRTVEGQPVCITCTFMDGFVLARSGFNHSANYRSVMVFGTARRVESESEKAAAMSDFVNGLFPGRWETLRAMTDQELNATSVLRMDIEEAMTKTRSGPPGDADEAEVPVWAGVIPMKTTLGAPQVAPDLRPDINLPASLEALVNSGRLR